MFLHILQFYKEDQLYRLDFHSFISIIGSDDLNVYSEEIVFESAKKWLDNNDKNLMATIFQYVRLPLLSAKVLYICYNFLIVLLFISN